MLKRLQRLFSLRIVRYALVGGIGIPINLAALAMFLHVMGDGLYPLALACSFEVSTTINFILNRLFTYSEQKHLHGWDWGKRTLRAQMTSLSAETSKRGAGIDFLGFRGNIRQPGPVRSQFLPSWLLSQLCSSRWSAFPVSSRRFS